MMRRSFSDIAAGEDAQAFAARFDATAPADELQPIPVGRYQCLVVAGEFSSSRNATPGYRVEFQVREGEHAGRRLWLDCWLSEKALPLARRDLAKLGIDRFEQLQKPLPRGLLADVKVGLRTGEDGAQWNRVLDFAIVGRVSVDDPVFGRSEPEA